MPHPVPNLAVNPIYGVAWIALIAWFILLIALAIVLYRATRHLRSAIRTHFAYWIASRPSNRALMIPPGALPRRRD